MGQLMVFTDSPLYAVANNLNVPNIKTVAQAVGVVDVLRITAYYPKRDTRHSIATLVQRHQDKRDLEIVYENFNKQQAVKLTVQRDVFDAIQNALLQNKFDKLEDQTNISHYDHSLWLVQRASGTYLHSVIMSPDVPHLPYSAIVNAIDNYLPEAIREVPLNR